jgi:small redox-active disulfide protein 2
MKIEVLGTGCPKCKKLSEAAEQAAKELGKPYELVKVTEIEKIMEYGVMMTPALLVDGKVKVVGRVPSGDEIKAMLTEV